MRATILVCSCGRRLKAAGLAPGARGLCPGCGRRIRMPGATEPEPPATEVEDEWNWTGTYGLEEPEPRAAARRRGGNGPDGREGPGADGTAASETDEGEAGDSAAAYELGADAREPSAAAPAPDPDPDPLPRRAAPTPPRSDDASSARPEPWWPPRIAYPARGPEGLAMAAALGVAFWVTATLIPEYCLAVLADAQTLGTPSMGRLVALISGLPALMLLPLVGIYGLRYLGRVLVSSAEGESRPPRPSDRNSEGLLSALMPWLVWLVLGLGPGALPLAAYRAGLGGSDPWLSAAAALAGLPYALMALLMGFLHDDETAARPGAVLGALARHLGSFLALTATVAALLASALGAFAASLLLRERHFAAYVLASLACWILASWSAIVTMHTLGSYVAPRLGRLGWRQTRLRWGERWSL